MTHSEANAAYGNRIVRDNRAYYPAQPTYRQPQQVYRSYGQTYGDSYGNSYGSGNGNSYGANGYGYQQQQPYYGGRGYQTRSGY